MKDFFIYANAGPDGVIVFENRPDPGLGRLPVGIACANESDRFRSVVSGLAELSNNSAFLLVPGVRQAKNQLKAIDAMTAFRERVQDAMKANGMKNAGRPDQ